MGKSVTNMYDCLDGCQLYLNSKSPALSRNESPKKQSLQCAIVSDKEVGSLAHTPILKIIFAILEAWFLSKGLSSLPQMHRANIMSQLFTEDFMPDLSTDTPTICRKHRGSVSVSTRV